MIMLLLPHALLYSLSLYADDSSSCDEAEAAPPPPPPPPPPAPPLKFKLIPMCTGQRINLCSILIPNKSCWLLL